MRNYTNARIKIIESDYLRDFENGVNSFIEQHPNVIDIQYTHDGNSIYRANYSALIVYVEVTDECQAES